MKLSLKEMISDSWKVLKIVVLVGVPVAMLLFHVWTQYRITKLGYEVAEQTEEHRELIEEQRKLSIEATYQGRTERVLSVATERFGLQPMEPEQVVSVDRATVEESGSAESDERAEHAALEIGE